MKINKKGFTLVEIIVTVIIIGALTLLIIPGVSRLMSQFREDYYVKLEKTTNESGKDFFNDNRTYRPKGILRSSYVNISTLINKKYTKDLLDYNGDSCLLEDKKSYVVAIYMGNEKYEYHTCVSCDSNKEEYYTDKNGTFCDDAWLTNDNIKYDFGKTNDIYIYYGTSREVVREKLLRTLNIVKVNDNNQELARVIAEAKDEGVLPNNVDEIDTTPDLSVSSTKVISLEYEIDGTKQELNAIIYKHSSPTVTIKKKIDNTNYEVGTWSNGVIISLNVNDEYLELSNTTVASYQWYVGGKWENISCSMSTKNSCSIAINENVNKTYKFRFVTNEGNISGETDNYNIKVDVTKPTIGINPNGGEVDVNLGENTGTVNFTLTTNDEGGSGIKSREYAISTNNTVEPTTFTRFYTDIYNYSEILDKGIYYVWSRVVDNAGNVSEEVWPSNKFIMKFSISYNSNGGTDAPNTQYKLYGGTLKLASNIPNREGYTFKGWANSSSSTEVIYNPGDNYIADDSIVLYAIWDINEYTLTLDSNGGSVNPNSYTKNYNTMITLPTPTRSEHTFIGWYTSKSGGTLVGTAGDTYTITKNTTLYAQWAIDSYTLTLDANGGSVNPDNYIEPKNTNITLPTPTREGYVFNGWYTSSSGGDFVGKAGESYTITKNATLYAQWDANTYEVKYNGNGNTSGSMSNSSHTYDVAKNLTTNSFEKKYTVTYNANGGTCSTTSTTASYSFLGWATSAKGSVTYNNGQSVKNLTTSGTYNLYAKWSGGSLALPTPTRTDYTFNRWYAEFNGSNYLNLGREYMYEDKISIHLEAYMSNWSAMTNDSQRFISCTESGGWNIESNGGYIQFAMYDKGVGYKLTKSSVTWASLGSGWHTFDIVFDGSKVYGYIDGELLTTSETFSSGKIGYNSENAIFIGAEAGSSATAPVDKYFTGYISNLVIKNDSSRMTSSNNSFVVPNQNMTLKAQWTQNAFTLTLDPNGGTVSPTSYTEAKDTTVTLPTPTRAGYKFNGWYTSTSGGSLVASGGASYKITYSRTLYAQWTQIQIPAHTCSGGTRTYTPNKTLTPYSTIQNYVLTCSKDYCNKSVNHWCSETSKINESCIPSGYSEYQSYTAYHVTCKVCGELIHDNTIWCPVHATGGNSITGGGGKGLKICDAKAKVYSSDATQCIGYLYPELGWELVSK